MKTRVSLKYFVNDCRKQILTAKKEYEEVIKQKDEDKIKRTLGQNMKEQI